MPKRVLVLLDDSAHHAAVPTAARLAREMGADIFLLRLNHETQPERLASMSRPLAHDVGRLSAQGAGLRVLCDRVDSATPIWQAVADRVATLRPDLIVLAADLSRGSDDSPANAAAQLMAHTSVPLMLCPASAAERLPQGHVSPRRLGATVIVPLDGSALAEDALPSAVACARAAQLPLLLIRVTPAMTLLGSGPAAQRFAAAALAERERQARQYLRAVRMRLEADHALEVHSMVLLGSPATEILRLAESHEGSLVVMSTQGQDDSSRSLAGSIAHRVLHDCPLPVLLVPQYAPAHAPVLMAAER